MLVYSNSCSFGSPTDHKIYPEEIASNLNATLINAGQPSSCNRRIIRTSLRDLLKLSNTNQNNILALIGLTFLSRTELWQPWLPADNNDGDFHSIQVDYQKLDWSKGLDSKIPNIHNYADIRVSDYYKHWLLHYNPEAEICNLLTDLILFCGWCKTNNIKYLIFCNTDMFPDVDFNTVFLSSLTRTINDDPNILNPWKFSFGTYALSKNHVPKDFKIYGKHGHPNEQAHIDFAQHLLLKYINV